MQIATPIKTLLTAGLALFILACNSSKKEKETKDISADTTVVLTPPVDNNTPKADTSHGNQKCYSNDGLKYVVTVTLNYTSATEVTGTVTSREPGSNKEEVATFNGTLEEDKLTVQFKETPPAIGAASQWTSKPWRREKMESHSERKEKLHIIFQAKNYATNKWEDADYQFIMVKCKR